MRMTRCPACGKTYEGSGYDYDDRCFACLINDVQPARTMCLDCNTEYEHPANVRESCPNCDDSKPRRRTNG